MKRSLLSRVLAAVMAVMLLALAGCGGAPQPGDAVKRREQRK